MNTDDWFEKFGIKTFTDEEQEKAVAELINKIDKSLIQFYIEKNEYGEFQFVFYNGTFVMCMEDEDENIILTIDEIYEKYSDIIAEAMFQHDIDTIEKVLLTEDEMIAEHEYAIGL